MVLREFRFGCEIFEKLEKRVAEIIIIGNAFERSSRVQINVFILKPTNRPRPLYYFDLINATRSLSDDLGLNKQ